MSTTSRMLAVPIMLICMMYALLVIGGCTDNQQGQDIFLQGREAVTQGRYQDGITMLQQYLVQAPKGEHASRALFFIAKARIGLTDYDSARIEFESLIQTYPHSQEANKAQYKLAMIDIWTGNKDQAIRRLTPMAQNPNGSLSPEAKAMLHYLLQGSDRLQQQPETH